MNHFLLLYKVKKGLLVFGQHFWIPDIVRLWDPRGQTLEVKEKYRQNSQWFIGRCCWKHIMEELHYLPTKLW